MKWFLLILGAIGIGVAIGIGNPLALVNSMMCAVMGALGIVGERQT